MNIAKPHRKLNRSVIIFILIMVVALVIRVVYLTQLSADEIGGELSIDSEFYWNLASDILAGKGLPEGALTFNPLYPFFLVVVFKFLGSSLLITRIVQSFLGLLTIAFIYLAGRRLAENFEKEKPSGMMLGVVAISMAVLYPQFFLYEGMILGTTLEILLLTASFTLGLALDEDLHGEKALRVGSKKVPPWLSGGILGAFCGAGALGRPNLFLLLLVALPIWLFARNRRKRIWLTPVLGFIVGAALFLLPPTIYNAKKSGNFVPVTTHGGINLYIGNIPGTYGVYQPPKNMRGEMRGLIEDARFRAEEETGRNMTDAEASDYYVHKTLENIKQNPTGWLILLGRKLILFWNKVEVHDMPEVLYFQDSLPLFKFPFLPFSVISALGIAGLIILLRSGKNRSIVCLFLGTSYVSILLFYLNSRYRIPIVPVVILLASYFIVWVSREISQKRFKNTTIMFAVALATFILISNRTMVKANKGSVYTFLGTYYMNAGEEAKAAKIFAKAYHLDPNRDTSIINYARTMMLQKQFKKAADIYARAYANNPRYPGLAIEYAYTLDKLGQHETAKEIALYVMSTDQQSEKVTACKILATNAFFNQGKTEAIKWVNKGLEISPEDPDLKLMLQAIQNMP